MRPKRWVTVQLRVLAERVRLAPSGLVPRLWMSPGASSFLHQSTPQPGSWLVCELPPAVLLTRWGRTSELADKSDPVSAIILTPYETLP